MLRSPLRYPGGKSRAVERIAALVPEFDEFREPFVGGGSVSIHLKQQFSDKRFWKNEFDDGKRLHKFLQTNKTTFNRLETAAAFFVFNRITFSGTTEAGGFSEQAFRLRFTDSSVERLTRMPEVLRGVRITDFDYEIVINALGDNFFLFLDPPYFSATDSALYGKNGRLHKDFDHARFARVLRQCPHRWLLTYDDSPFVRELFAFANIKSWNLMYGMRNVAAESSQIGSELLISNFDLSESGSRENQKGFVF